MENEEKKKIRNEQIKAWKKANKDKVSKQNAEYREKNKEKLKKYGQDYYNSNKDIKKEYGKEYYKNVVKENKDLIKLKKECLANFRKSNKEHIKEYNRNYTRERLKINPVFRLAKSVRSAINKSFKSISNKKNTKTSLILGCSFDEFKKYIENKFDSWMNWDNYGTYNVDGIRTWQIDHIVPISTAKTIEDVIRLNHFKNLRPLCSKENLDKSDNFNKENLN